jgi:Gpi18-like mannosyltransferase
VNSLFTPLQRLYSSCRRLSQPRDTGSSAVAAPITPTTTCTSDFQSVLVLCLALVALVAKVAIAYNTLGTNDAVFFYGFGYGLDRYGLEWTYRHSIYFNHPPLTAYYLRAIYALSQQQWCRDQGIHFPFLLRLPSIFADFFVVLVLVRMSKLNLGFHLPTWALALFAVSPVSLMVSGFHGNTDPVMVLFLICAAFMCVRNRPTLCGLFFTLSCQIKVVCLLLTPAFAFFWFARRKTMRFTIAVTILSAALWSEPLLKCPALFLKNVLAYGSYWGIWGLTYCLRLTHLDCFSRVSFFDLSIAQTATMSLLKVVIVATTVVIAWRRRQVAAPEFLHSLAYIWIVFFVFAPGVCVQYLVWLAPFVLILSPTFYAYFLVASSSFLFAFYNVTAHGLPWMVSVSMDEFREQWAPYSLLPWAVLIAGWAALWRKGSPQNLASPLVSYEVVPVENG